jgi:hypothetical protein
MLINVFNKKNIICKIISTEKAPSLNLKCFAKFLCIQVLKHSNTRNGISANGYTIGKEIHFVKLTVNK